MNEFWLLDARRFLHLPDAPATLSAGLRVGCAYAVAAPMVSCRLVAGRSGIAYGMHLKNPLPLLSRDGISNPPCGATGCLLGVAAGVPVLCQGWRSQEFAAGLAATSPALHRAGPNGEE